MSARCRDGDCAFGHLLTTNVREVDVISGKLFKPVVQFGWRRFHRQRAGKETDGLRQRVHGDHFNRIDNRCFGAVVLRDDDAAKPFLLGRRHRHS